MLTIKTMQELTSIEASKLSEYEAVIAKSISSFYDMGNALKEIRDNKLYREKFETFEEYCEVSWSISRPRAYQLIDSKKVMDNLSTIVDKPINESHARELAKIEDPEQQREAWNRLMEQKEESHEPLTAKQIKLVVSEYCAPCVLTNCDYRIVTYLTPNYYKKFDTQKRGEKEADYFRRVIEAHLDHPELLLPYMGQLTA